MTALGGLIVYSIVNIFLDDAETWLTQQVGGAIFIALCGVLLGWAAGIYWQRSVQNRSKRKS
jgi:hypothetical protein